MTIESSVMVFQPHCDHRAESIGVYGGGPVPRTGYDRGGYQGNTAERREAMGIDWMIGQELAEAIPPAYTQFLGEQLMHAVRVSA